MTKQRGQPGVGPLSDGDVVELIAFRDELVWQIRVFQHDTYLLMNTLTEPA